jgi:hypothetical protein
MYGMLKISSRRGTDCFSFFLVGKDHKAKIEQLKKCRDEQAKKAKQEVERLKYRSGSATILLWDISRPPKNKQAKLRSHVSSTNHWRTLPNNNFGKNKKLMALPHPHWI